MLEQFCSNSLCCNMFDMLILTIWPLKTSRLANQALGYVKQLHAFYPFLRSKTWTRWINLLKIWADVPSTAPVSCAPVKSWRRESLSCISMMHFKTQCMTSTFDQMSAQITANPSDIVTLSEAQRPNQLLLNHASILGFVATYRNRNVCSVISTDPFLATHVNEHKF